MRQGNGGRPTPARARRQFSTTHRLFGRVIAPAAQHGSMLIAAMRAASRVEACTLSGRRFPEALRLGEEETRARLASFDGDVDMPT